MVENYLKTLSFLLFLLLSNISHALNVTDEPYVKGTILTQKYQEIIAHYRKSGLSNAKYLSSENFKQFFSMAKANQFDVVFASNINARILIEKYQYIPVLVRVPGFKSVVITSKSSGIKTVDDLAEQTIYSPTVFDPTSYLGKESIKGINVNIVELSDVSQIIVKVLSGKGKAGFVAEADIRHLISSVRDQLKVLASSEGSFTTYVLISRQNIDKREKIKNAVMSSYSSAQKTYVEKNWGKFRYVELNKSSIAELYNNDAAMMSVIEALE